MYGSLLEQAFGNALVTPRVALAGGASAACPLVVRYVGTNDTTRRIGLFGVSSIGDLLFFVGSTAASASLDATISGGGSGRIDVSNGSYDTFGEVADRINAGTATHGWSAILRDALRSDSSDDTLAALTRTNANVQVPAGRPLLQDNLVRYTVAVSVKRRRSFSEGDDGKWMPVVRRFTANGNAGPGTPTLQFSIYSRVGTTETLLNRWTGADATERTENFAQGQKCSGLQGPVGGELIVEMGPVSTFSSIAAAGYVNVEEQIVHVADLRSA